MDKHGVHMHIEAQTPGVAEKYNLQQYGVLLVVQFKKNK